MGFLGYWKSQFNINKIGIFYWPFLVVLFLITGFIYLSAMGYRAVARVLKAIIVLLVFIVFFKVSVVSAATLMYSNGGSTLYTSNYAEYFDATYLSPYNGKCVDYVDVAIKNIGTANCAGAHITFAYWPNSGQSDINYTNEWVVPDLDDGVWITHTFYFQACEHPIVAVNYGKLSWFTSSLPSNCSLAWLSTDDNVTGAVSDSASRDMYADLYESDTISGSICGDGQIDGSEQCDDGNVNNNDGCSSSCQIESRWSCIGEPSVCTFNCRELPVIDVSFNVDAIGNPIYNVEQDCLVSSLDLNNPDDWPVLSYKFYIYQDSSWLELRSGNIDYQSRVSSDGHVLFNGFLAVGVRPGATYRFSGIVQYSGYDESLEVYDDYTVPADLYNPIPTDETLQGVEVNDDLTGVENLSVVDLSTNEPSCDFGFISGEWLSCSWQWFKWLIIPDKTIFEPIISLWNFIKGRKPFSYTFDAFDYIKQGFSYNVSVVCPDWVMINGSGAFSSFTIDGCSIRNSVAAEFATGAGAVLSSLLGVALALFIVGVFIAFGTSVFEEILGQGYYQG